MLGYDMESRRCARRSRSATWPWFIRIIPSCSTVASTRFKCSSTRSLSRTSRRASTPRSRATSSRPTTRITRLWARAAHSAARQARRRSGALSIDACRPSAGGGCDGRVLRFCVSRACRTSTRAAKPSPALRRLAMYTENRLSIVQVGGLLPLGSAAQVMDLEIQREVAACLCHVSLSDENKVPIVISNAIKPMLMLCQSADVEVARLACARGREHCRRPDDASTARVQSERDAYPLLSHAFQAHERASRGQPRREQSHSRRRRRTPCSSTRTVCDRCSRSRARRTTSASTTRRSASASSAPTSATTTPSSPRVVSNR